jgi:hypothetical protein
VGGQQGYGEGGADGGEGARKLRGMRLGRDI